MVQFFGTEGCGGGDVAGFRKCVTFNVGQSMYHQVGLRKPNRRLENYVSPAGHKLR